MAVNILDMVKGAVSDQIIRQIGGLIGQPDNNKTSTIFETATQSILGGLINKASSPEGAQDVFKAIESQDDSLMDKLGDLLGEGREAELEQAGGSAIDLIFGDKQGGILEAVAKFLGLDGSVVGKLLKMAAPIIMSVITKYVKSKALDAVGLGSLLGEQKSSLSSALPLALSGSLGFGSFLGNTTESMQNAGSAATGAASEAPNAGGSVMKILLPIILIGALAVLGYTIMSDEAPSNKQEPILESLDTESGTAEH